MAKRYINFILLCQKQYHTGAKELAFDIIQENPDLNAKMTKYPLT